MLNRYGDSDNLDHTIHVMKYIFPRQFGLHNPFTSSLDPRETIQPFKDYTLREQEISRHQCQAARKVGAKDKKSLKQHLPKRLRGSVIDLVKKLQILHSRCSYKELLEHYCHLNVRSCFPQLYVRQVLRSDRTRKLHGVQTQTAIKTTSICKNLLTTLLRANHVRV